MVSYQLSISELAVGLRNGPIVSIYLVPLDRVEDALCGVTLS